MENLSILVLLFLFPFFQNETTNEEITVSHDIESITVYLNGAEINRKGQINVPRGKSDLLLRGISSRISNQGIKIKLSKGVKVYAVNVEANDKLFENDDVWKNLIQKEQEISTAKNKLQVELNTLDAELDYWDANMRLSNNNSFSQLDTGAEYFREKIQKVYTQIFAIKEQVYELTEQQSKNRLAKDDRTAELNKIDQMVRITVISEAAQDCNIDLRYLVSHAIWKPYYSLRTEGEGAPITLEYQAQIYNDSGNDWNNKPLTLAILDPSQDVSKPQMYAWVLDQYGYYNNEGKLSDSKGLYNDKRNGNGLEYNILQVDDLSTRFEIKDLHLIPADATPHLIDVTSYTKEADYYTLSIPKVKDGAFLIAQIHQWESLGLLDGPMDLYYKDTYQGVSQLNTKQVSDTMDISLGKENSYTITRRKLSSMSNEKLIGFTIKETLTYEFIVKNKKNQAAEIELRDQLPISADKDVEVKPLVISGAKVDAMSGQLTWNIKLKPLESKKIILKFSVKYPKSKRGMLKHDKKKIASPRFF